MKLETLLSKANEIRKYPRRRRKAKLYHQWVERADLAPGAIPQEEVAQDIIPKRRKEQIRLPLMYLLLGFFVGMLCMGLIFLSIQSC